MIKLIRLFFSLRLIIIVTSSINLSLFNSAAYIPVNSTNTTWHNGTCSECICFAFVLNSFSDYQALNCYTNNNTCLLFRNFLSEPYIYINTNSKLFFPSVSTYTTAVNCINAYGQCGGYAWNSSTSCCAGLSCVYQNNSYSQCSTTTNTPTTPASTNTSTTVSYFNSNLPNATIGTYWSCCKPSCSWPNKANFTNPPASCLEDGVTVADPNTASACTGGNAYMCTNQQPWNVSDSLSYGFAGAGIVNESESDWCGACYSLVFTSGPITGKQIIVQVVNTQYLPYNMFVLQMPGGGWSTDPNECLNQFSNFSSNVWGTQFGGVTDSTDCENLPPVFQASCYWRFDWFGNANNSTVQFNVTSCPLALTNITGCTRL